MDKISIVIPVYNAAKYLRECLDSVAAQSYENLEIICVNDASEDGSLEILNAYAAKDSRFVIIDEGKFGSAACRNIGLERATGVYCICLDADDFFDREMIAKAYAKISQSGADICMFPYYEYDDKAQKKLGVKGFSNKVRVVGDVFCAADYPDNIFTFINGSTWNKLYRREFLELYGFRYLNVPACNDLTFTFLTVANAEKIALLSEPLLYYRVNLDNSITSKRQRTIGAAMEAVDKWKEGLKQTGRWDVFRKAFMRQAFVLLRVDYKFCGREMRETLKRQIIDYCSGDDWHGFKDIDFEIFKLDVRKSGKLRYWGQLLWLKLRKKLGGI